MENQYIELINVNVDHASLDVEKEGDKHFLIVGGSYFSEAKEISKQLHDLLLDELDSGGD